MKVPQSILEFMIILGAFTQLKSLMNDSFDCMFPQIKGVTYIMDQVLKQSTNKKI